MIELIIFQLHIVGILYAFTTNWQKKGLRDGILSVLIIGLLFTIGWSLTTPLAGLIYPSSWKSIYFTKDTLSLLLLFIPECVFFNIFFLKDRN
jgi:hypothetical protein